jgi:transposase
LVQFHPEFNLIEQAWAVMKRALRAQMTGSSSGFNDKIITAFHDIDLHLIRKFFRKSRDTMAHYAAGKAYKDIKAGIKEYKKSHRTGTDDALVAVDRSDQIYCLE